MNNTRAWWAVGIIVIAIIATGGLLYVRHLPHPASGPTLLAPVTIPDGWYAHRVTPYEIVLTQSPDDVVASTTDIYTLGDQIDITRTVSSVPEKVWLWTNGIDTSGSSVHLAQWQYLRGWDVLYMWHDTAADTELSAYFFKGNIVYSVSLYPYHKMDGVSAPDPRLAAFEMVIDQYIPEE